MCCLCRVWQGFKRTGLADAVTRAEAEARAYLDSMEGHTHTAPSVSYCVAIYNAFRYLHAGKDWLENVAYEQAEEMLMDLV